MKRIIRDIALVIASVEILVLVCFSIFPSPLPEYAVLSVGFIGVIAAILAGSGRHE